MLRVRWDGVGLVRASGRTEGGFRLYTSDDEQRVRLPPADRAEYFRAESRARRAKLARQLAAADEFLERIEPVRPEARDRGPLHTR